MKKRLLMLLSAAVCLTFVLAGCGSSDAGQNAAAGSDSAESAGIGNEESAGSTAQNDSGAADGEAADKDDEAEAGEAVTLNVAMLGKDIKTACVILAKELGYFEEEGVSVNFEQVSSLPEGLTAVSTGKLDVLPYGVIPSCSFVSQGTDVVVFGGTISEGSEAIALPENKDSFKNPEDFKGKKIGCFRMETGHMVMKGYLREAGLDITSDVEFIYLDSQASIMEAVLKGEVDLGFVNSGYGYIAKQSGAEVAFAVGDYVEDFPCCRQTTSRQALNEKKDALIKFETALLRAYDVYLNDHDTVIEKLTAYSGQDAAYVEAIMYGTDDYENAMIISLDPNKKKVIDFYEVMKDNGDIDASTPYDMADYIDTTVYESALNIMFERGTNEALYQQLLKEFEEND